MLKVLFEGVGRPVGALRPVGAPVNETFEEQIVETDCKILLFGLFLLSEDLFGTGRVIGLLVEPGQDAQPLEYFFDNVVAESFVPGCHDVA